MYNCSGVFWECCWVENHSQTMIRYLKRLNSSMFVRVKDFPIYGSIGVSAPSLHRESTDSLIFVRLTKSVCIPSFILIGGCLSELHNMSLFFKFHLFTLLRYVS